MTTVIEYEFTFTFYRRLKELQYPVCADGGVCRYGFEGMLQAIYGFDREPLDCEHDDVKQCLFRQPDDVLRKLDVEYAHFYVDFVILCSFFVVLRAGCYFVLRWRARVH